MINIFRRPKKRGLPSYENPPPPPPKTGENEIDRLRALIKNAWYDGYNANDCPEEGYKQFLKTNKIDV